MRHHRLKIEPKYYEAVVSQRKTFEIRREDRGFNVGDWLVLEEWHGGYTGQSVHREITYISGYMQTAGYVVLGMS